MAFRIVFVDESIEDLRRLGVFHRSAVRDAIERHLRHQPGLISKSRIKRLEDIESPQYRLRVGELRVFYDIAENDVIVLNIMTKEESLKWLRERGKKK
jgi:mRNA-degrading endonuclease RelE of RelBE toxin-antitoxin system